MESRRATKSQMMGMLNEFASEQQEYAALVKKARKFLNQAPWYIPVPVLIGIDNDGFLYINWNDLSLGVAAEVWIFEDRAPTLQIGHSSDEGPEFIGSFVGRQASENLYKMLMVADEPRGEYVH